MSDAKTWVWIRGVKVNVFPRLKSWGEKFYKNALIFNIKGVLWNWLSFKPRPNVGKNEGKKKIQTFLRRLLKT